LENRREGVKEVGKGIEILGECLGNVKEKLVE